MNAFLDQHYFDWLYGQVCSVKAKNPSKTYRNLLHILFTKEVIWFVPNDDNRLEDGRDLRYEFLDSEHIAMNPQDKLWLDLGCSFLEFLIGISRRGSFMTDIPEDVWFWDLMENLGLKKFNDRAQFDREEVEDVLDRVIWRTYNYDGSGGLFPLESPSEDQRKIEVWYQLNAYVQERDLI